MGAIKIMLDGVIESRTADMLEPYLDVPSKGAPNFTPERLRQIVTRIDRSGWQIITHALGDGAIRLALDTYEAAARANPAPAAGRRHRIEHLEAVSAADIPRFASLGVIASLQPAHARGMLNTRSDRRTHHEHRPRASRLRVAMEEHRGRRRPHHLRQRLACRLVESHWQLLRRAHARSATRCRGSTAVDDRGDRRVYENRSVG